MRDRFDAGAVVVGIGAVLLLVSLFVDWYEPGGDAWAVFELVDVLLAGIALASLVALFTRSPRLSEALPLMALAALAVVAVQLIDLPPAARGADRESGAWMALGGSALMALGAVLALASVSVIVAVRGRERRRRTAAVDARETPTEPVAASDPPTQTLDPVDDRPGGQP